MENTVNAEITIRLENEVLTAIDHATQSAGLLSRRATVEKILRKWYELAWLRQELDRETENYYKTLTPEEIVEERAWAQFASAQALQRRDD